MKTWDYNEAFSRNRGLISVEEQDRLRNSRVAIAGMGGVGGIDMIMLARLGISKFTIADFDVFETANFNRQYGATMSTLGQSKAEVMKAKVLDINPEADVRVFNEPIGAENADAFLDGADIFVDGIDAFVIRPRRLLYNRAFEKGIYTINAGPIGFSTSFLVFDPKGMSCDDYFDFSDEMSDADMFINFVIGVAPSALHRVYMDFAYVNIKKHTGPSSALACHLCAGIVGSLVLKILLGRGPLYAAPYYHQFDAYREIFVRKKLIYGNRNPIQRFKKLILKRKLIQLGGYK